MNEEKLLRLGNLRRVLSSRGVEDRDRARYLMKECGKGISYWSGLIAGDRPFGEKIARHIEESLGLPRGFLDGDDGAMRGRAIFGPDAMTIGEAFDALPADTPASLSMRRRLYAAILAMLSEQTPDGPSSAAQQPVAQPTGALPRPSKTRP